MQLSFLTQLAGPQQGRKAFTLQTVPAQGNREEHSSRVAKACGFSVHAGVVAEADERHKLERLCRYITRPAIAEQRLSLTPRGGCVTSSKPPTVTAPPMWCSNRSISSPA